MSASGTPAVELLDVDNYASWRTKMRLLLVLKGLWPAVTGDSTDEEKDGKAFALLGLHVKDHHLPVLERCNTAKAAWDQLEAVYQAKSNARKRQLRKELSQLKMGAAEPLAKYVARAKEIQNQLQAAGHTVADQEVCWAVLAGLPPAYDTVVTVLETSTDADMKLDDLLPKLMPVEQKMAQGESSHSGEAALLANRKKSFGSKETRSCYYCGKVGHIQQNCLKKKQEEVTNRPRRHFSSIAL